MEEVADKENAVPVDQAVLLTKKQRKQRRLSKPHKNGNFLQAAVSSEVEVGLAAVAACETLPDDEGDGQTQTAMGNEKFGQRNDDELEKIQRRRRRMSRLSHVRRKSLTPTAKKMEYVSDMYSTIIQMSSENKINQKNTWSLHLIDHMDDILEHKREQDESDTYNFQKASCTLDASIKIYSYRVDDTWNSSFKILENLSSNNDKTSVSEKIAQKDTSKKLCIAKTLETNLNNINSKSFDLGFQTDPLFHKMSRIFDEGGAKGLLLANLNVNNGCNLIFDSMDTHMSLEQVEKEEMAKDSLVNVANLSQKLRSLCGSTTDLAICPNLKIFYDIIENGDSGEGRLCNRRSKSSSVFSSKRASVISEGGDFLEPLDDDDDVYFDCGENNFEASPELDNNDINMTPEEEWLGVQQERCLQMSLDEGNELSGDIAIPTPTIDPSMDVLSDEKFSSFQVALRESALAGENEYSFFDSKFLKNWAGPDHWKFRGIRKKPPVAQETICEKTSKKASRSSDLKIDFQHLELIPDGAFDSSKTRSLISQSAGVLKKLEENALKLVLPLDVHYKPQDLFSLFLKPQYRFRVLRHDHRPLGDKSLDKENNNTGSFFDCGMDTFDDDNDGVFDSNHDVNFMDDDFKVDGLLEAERTVGKIDIKYETVAKRVDVKKLKESIWSHLEHTIDETVTSAASHAEEVGKNDSMQPLPAEEQSTEEIISFDSVIQNLSEKVPENVTVSFYFICVLHLANEKGLKLVGQDDLSNFSIGKDESA